MSFPKEVARIDREAFDATQTPSPVPPREHLSIPQGLEDLGLPVTQIAVPDTTYAMPLELAVASEPSLLPPAPQAAASEQGGGVTEEPAAASPAPITMEAVSVEPPVLAPIIDSSVTSSRPNPVELARKQQEEEERLREEEFNEVMAGTASYQQLPGTIRSFLAPRLQALRARLYRERTETTEVAPVQAATEPDHRSVMEHVHAARRVSFEQRGLKHAKVRDPFREVIIPVAGTATTEEIAEIETRHLNPVQRLGLMVGYHPKPAEAAQEVAQTEVPQPQQHEPAIFSDPTIPKEGPITFQVPGRAGELSPALIETYRTEYPGRELRFHSIADGRTTTIVSAAGEIDTHTHEAIPPRERSIVSITRAGTSPLEEGEREYPLIGQFRVVAWEGLTENDLDAILIGLMRNPRLFITALTHPRHYHPLEIRLPKYEERQPVQERYIGSAGVQASAPAPVYPRY